MPPPPYQRGKVRRQRTPTKISYSVYTTHLTPTKMLLQYNCGARLLAAWSASPGDSSFPMYANYYLKQVYVLSGVRRSHVGAPLFFFVERISRKKTSHREVSILRK